MWKARFVVLCAVLLGVLGAACARPRVPVVPLQAPPALARLRIHVYNADRERAEREERVNLYTIFLRQAFERSLVRAGYRVVGDPALPHDLVAVVTLGDFEISSRKTPEATASLTLRAGSRIVDQLAAIMVRDDYADIDDHGPAALADAVTRSPQVAALAAALPAEPKEPPALTVPAR